MADQDPSQCRKRPRLEADDGAHDPPDDHSQASSSQGDFDVIHLNSPPPSPRQSDRSPVLVEIINTPSSSNDECHAITDQITMTITHKRSLNRCEATLARRAGHGVPYHHAPALLDLLSDDEAPWAEVTEHFSTSPLLNFAKIEYLAEAFESLLQVLHDPTQAEFVDLVGKRKYLGRLGKACKALACRETVDKQFLADLEPNTHRLYEIVQHLGHLCALLAEAETVELDRIASRRDSLGLDPDYEIHPCLFASLFEAMILFTDRQCAFWMKLQRVGPTTFAHEEAAAAGARAFCAQSIGVDSLLEGIKTLGESLHRLELSPSIFATYLTLTQTLYTWTCRSREVASKVSINSLSQYVALLLRDRLPGMTRLVAMLPHSMVGPDYHHTIRVALYHLHEDAGQTSEFLAELYSNAIDSIGPSLERDGITTEKCRTAWCMHQQLIVYISYHLSMVEACMGASDASVQLYGVRLLNDVLHDVWKNRMTPAEQTPHPIIDYFLRLISSLDVLSRVTADKVTPDVIRELYHVVYLMGHLNYVDKTHLDHIWDACCQSPIPLIAEAGTELLSRVIPTLRQHHICHLMARADRSYQNAIQGHQIHLVGTLFKALDRRPDALNHPYDCAWLSEVCVRCLRSIHIDETASRDAITISHDIADVLRSLLGQCSERLALRRLVDLSLEHAKDWPLLGVKAIGHIESVVAILECGPSIVLSMVREAQNPSLLSQALDIFPIPVSGPTSSTSSLDSALMSSWVRLVVESFRIDRVSANSKLADHFWSRLATFDERSELGFDIALAQMQKHSEHADLLTHLLEKFLPCVDPVHTQLPVDALVRLLHLLQVGKLKMEKQADSVIYMLDLLKKWVLVSPATDACLAGTAPTTAATAATAYTLKCAIIDALFAPPPGSVLSNFELEKTQRRFNKEFIAALQQHRPANLRAIEYLHDALSKENPDGTRNMRSRSWAPSSVATEVNVASDAISGRMDNKEDPKLGRLVSDLLCRLEPTQSAKATFKASVWDPEQLFPLTATPARSLYSLHVLESHLWEIDPVRLLDLAPRAVHLMRQILSREPANLSIRMLGPISNILTALMNACRGDVSKMKAFEEPVGFLESICCALSRLDTYLCRTPKLRDPAHYRSISSKLYDCFITGITTSSRLCHAFLTSDDIADGLQKLLLGHAPGSGIATYILGATCNFCQAPLTPTPVIDRFWTIVYNILGNAVHKPRETMPLLHIAPSLLDAKFRRSQEDLIDQEVRRFATRFAEVLGHIKHIETRDSPADLRISGLVSMIQQCSNYMMSRPSSLDGLRRDADIFDKGSATALVTHLFDSLLFPRQLHKTATQPIYCVETRGLVYRLIEALTGDQAQHKLLLDRILILIKDADRRQEFSGFEQPRAACGFVGLINLGQTCYLDSILQQLFMNIDFRNFILSIQVDEDAHDSVLNQLQRAFTFLQGMQGRAYNPCTLTQALNIDTTSQEDAHIFFTELISKLEDSMPDKATRQKLGTFFNGRNKSQTRGKCGHVSEATDVYCNLSLVVKGKKTLADSLQDYVEGAVLEGGDRYKCSVCEVDGKEAYVDAMRRTGLEIIPDNLVIGLKRFRYETYDGGTKVNDYFDFPEQIDMAPYKLDHLVDPSSPVESDVFELAGVIVHQGTLQFGHYWSFVKTDPQMAQSSPGTWLCFNDSDVNVVDFERVKAESCGGITQYTSGLRVDRSENAYVLFYRRKRPAQQHDDNMEPTAESHEYDIAVPDYYQAVLEAYNQRFDFKVHINSEHHQYFLRRLYERTHTAINSAGDLSKMDRDACLVARWHLYEHTDFHPCEAVVKILTELVERVTAVDDASAHDAFYELWEQPGSNEIWMFSNEEVRRSCATVTSTCLDRFRGIKTPDSQWKSSQPRHEVKYMNALSVLLNGHDLMSGLLPNRNVSCWRTYFDIVSSIAARGSFEACEVLRHDALWLAIAKLYKAADSSSSAKRLLHAEVLVKFIQRILSEYVDLTRGPDSELDTVELSKDNPGRVWLSARQWDDVFVETEEGYLYMITAVLQLSPLPQLDEDWIPWPAAQLILTLLKKTRSRESQLALKSLCAHIREENVDEDDLAALTITAAVICTDHETSEMVQLRLITEIINRYQLRQDNAEHMIRFMSLLYPFHPTTGILLDHVSHWLPLLITHEDAESCLVAASSWFSRFILGSRIFNGLLLTEETLTLDLKRYRAVCRVFSGLNARCKTILDAQPTNEADIEADHDILERAVSLLKGCISYINRAHLVVHKGVLDTPSAKFPDLKFFADDESRPLEDFLAGEEVSLKLRTSFYQETAPSSVELRNAAMKFLVGFLQTVKQTTGVYRPEAILLDSRLTLQQDSGDSSPSYCTDERDPDVAVATAREKFVNEEEEGRLTSSENANEKMINDDRSEDKTSSVDEPRAGSNDGDDITA